MFYLSAQNHLIPKGVPSDIFVGQRTHTQVRPDKEGNGADYRVID
jgi:hypothetical protein